MPPIWNDIASLLPSSHPVVSPLPELGSQAPLPPTLDRFDQDTIVAFVRHCGCPFAAAEVKQLAKMSKEHPDLRVVIVTMSEEDVTKEWFEENGGDFADRARVTLIADPKRETYAKFGVGLLPFSGLFSGAMMTELKALAKRGIKNTATRDGSRRWQNSGGFCVARGGELRWMHIAEHAGDMCDYEQAVASLKEKAKL